MNPNLKKSPITLHKQFGHPKSARLIDLIKTAGISDKDLLDMVKGLDKSCEICMTYKDQVQDQWSGFH